MNKKIVIIVSSVVVIVSLIVIGIVFFGSNDHIESSHTSKTYYCPMHPQVTSNEPSVCPICQMDLVEKNKIPNQEMMMLTLAKSQQVLAKIRITVVNRMDLPIMFSAPGLVTFAENSKKIVASRVMGRIEKVYHYSVGSPIKKGSLLYRIYSEDFIQAQTELFAAVNSENANAVNSAKLKLLRLGVSSETLNTLLTKKEIQEFLDIASPFSGSLITNNATEGMYVNEGYPLFEIADLSAVQVIAQIFPNQAAQLKMNTKVRIKVTGDDSKILDAKIAFAYPEADPTTNLVQVRVEVLNKEQLLKVNMNVVCDFSTEEQNVLAVPNSAILSKGDKNILWIQQGQDTFVPTLVITGRKNEEFTEIIAGISEQDSIATDGNYLLDSEAQLRWGEYHTVLRENYDTEIPIKSNGTVSSAKSEQEKRTTTTIFNKFCPILGEEIDPQVPTVKYKDKNIGFCCKGCDKKFLSNPEKYIKNISSDGSKFVGTIEE